MSDTEHPAASGTGYQTVLYRKHINVRYRAPSCIRYRVPDGALQKTH